RGALIERRPRATVDSILAVTASCSARAVAPRCTRVQNARASRDRGHRRRVARAAGPCAWDDRAAPAIPRGRAFTGPTRAAEYQLPARLVPATSPASARRLSARRPQGSTRGRAHIQTDHAIASGTRARGRRRMKTWLTVAEAAAYAGVSRYTIYTA